MGASAALRRDCLKQHRGQGTAPTPLDAPVGAPPFGAIA